MARQQRAERTRDAILRAAAAEFDEFGYEGARLDRIIERTDATKGAVYFHFKSKLDIAKALVEEKYTNWPVIVAEVTGSGRSGIEAARELTHRVADVFVRDIRVRAAMKLTQTVLPPSKEDNPYERWTQLITVFIDQAARDGEISASDPRAFAAVAVQGFFGAYMIDHELGLLDQLASDVDRLWDTLAPPLTSA
jgi:AcrR family transcriptional regulator